MKLIHCADIHLGSKLNTYFDKDTAKERRNELTLTFGRLAEYAKTNGVQAVIIAGDLFDETASLTVGLADSLFRIIEDAPSVDFLYLTGNHDNNIRLADAEGVPDNLKFFGDSWTYFNYGEVTIAGVSLSEVNRSSVYETLSLSEYRTNIAVMHGKEGRGIRKDRADVVNLGKLGGKNIDYLALGDYHSYKAEKLDTRGVYCYSGCLEGRGFDEIGQKGFVLLTCKRGGIRHEFVPHAKRTIHIVQADITDARSSADIEKLADSALAGIPKTDIVSIELIGECSPELFKNLVYLKQKLSSSFFFADVADKTRIKIDPLSYVGGVSLKSEFIRLVLADDNLSEEERNRIIGCGIAALKGEEVNL